MPIIKDKRTPYDKVWHYSRLYWGWKCASENGTSEDVVLVVYDTYIPNGLSDVDIDQ